MSEQCNDCLKKLPDEKRKIDPMWEAKWPCGLYVKPVGCTEYTRPQAPEAPEDWEKELKTMLNGMTFPNQIVSYVKALLKAEREKVCGEIAKMVNPASKNYDADNILDQIDAKIAEIRGRV